MPESESGYRAFRGDAGAVWLPRDFLSVSGPDTVSFLQGQMSQDVNLPTGGSAWSLLLQPQGKVVALVRLWREASDRYVIDTDAGFGAVVAERLNRFKLRVKAEIEPIDWKCLAIRGPRAHAAAGAGAETAPGEHVVVADWPGLPGADIIGESPEPPAGVPVCEIEAYETVRIEAGIPVMGRELDENVIPAEAGIVDRTVSFTKGCYTGQELVARIDSRGGNVPRRLRGIVVDGDDVPPANATVNSGDKEVGRITSAVRSPGREAVVALAFVGRAVEPPADVTVAWDGHSAPARVEQLPLVGE